MYDKLNAQIKELSTAFFLDQSADECLDLILEPQKNKGPGHKKRRKALARFLSALERLARTR